MLNERALFNKMKAGAVLRYSTWDSFLIGLSIVHALVLVSAPSIPVIAILLWWNSNTISHNFIHRSFFRSNVMNRVYSTWLTLLLGFPQSLWRDRHLAHHKGKASLGVTSATLGEFATVVAMWVVLLARMPGFFFTTYLPGLTAGLSLCFLHGYFEHWQAVTSHYGTAYNILFFNDGYHSEHHLRPGEHWSGLPALAQQNARVSRWPAPLRWIEAINLETLERVTMRSVIIRGFLLRTHEQALRRLLPQVGQIRTVKIVGGGLFPRTAILLRKLVPDAEITIVDRSATNLATANQFFQEAVTWVNDLFDPAVHDQADVVVIPLALAGNRTVIYDSPPARAVLVHDWIWRKRGESAVVSIWLLKRLNLVRQKPEEPALSRTRRLKPTPTSTNPL